MLILSRKPGERIIVTLTDGTQIIIGIGTIDCKGNSATVGVEAAREIIVDREEIHLQKEEERCQMLPRIIKNGTSPLSLKKP